MIAALYDLEMNSAAAMNIYVLASVTEMVWTILGPEFGNNTRKTAVVVRALHGLKSAKAALRSFRKSCMESMGYVPCQVEPDL